MERESASVNGEEDEQSASTSAGGEADDADIYAFFEAQHMEMLRMLHEKPGQGASSSADQPERAALSGNAPCARDVLEYARSARLPADEAQAQRFIAEQSAHGWKDSNGAPIRDWRRWFDGWLARQPAWGARSAVPTSMQYDMRTYTPDELERLVNNWEDD